MADNDFSWNDRNLVAVPEQEPIAVYTNPDNNVVLRFRDSSDEQDRWVVVDPLNVDRLCAALQKAKEASLSAASDLAETEA